jgi:hypothetical protein
LGTKGRREAEGGTENCIVGNFIILYYIIIKVTESRRIREAGHVARMEKLRNAYETWTENLEGKTTRHLYL